MVKSSFVLLRIELVDREALRNRQQRKPTKRC